jgi:hypothetical protein
MQKLYRQLPQAIFSLQDDALFAAAASVSQVSGSPRRRCFRWADIASSIGMHTIWPTTVLNRGQTVQFARCPIDAIGIRPGHV